MWFFPWILFVFSFNTSQINVRWNREQKHERKLQCKCVCTKKRNISKHRQRKTHFISLTWLAVLKSIFFHFFNFLKMFHIWFSSPRRQFSFNLSRKKHLLCCCLVPFICTYLFWNNNNDRNCEVIKRRINSSVIKKCNTKVFVSNKASFLIFKIDCFFQSESFLEFCNLYLFYFLFYKTKKWN